VFRHTREAGGEKSAQKTRHRKEPQFRRRRLKGLFFQRWDDGWGTFDGLFLSTNFLGRARKLLLAALLLPVMAAGQRSSCSPESVSFEIVTGFVYTAPADMLDSQPGSLMLTDCIDTCRKNESCKSINYETGLCVMFSSSADDDSGERTLRAGNGADICLSVLLSNPKSVNGLLPLAAGLSRRVARLAEYVFLGEQERKRRSLRNGGGGEYLRGLPRRLRSSQLFREGRNGKGSSFARVSALSPLKRPLLASEKPQSATRDVAEAAEAATHFWPPFTTSRHSFFTAGEGGNVIWRAILQRARRSSSSECILRARASPKTSKVDPK